MVTVVMVYSILFSKYLALITYVVKVYCCRDDVFRHDKLTDRDDRIFVTISTIYTFLSACRENILVVVVVVCYIHIREKYMLLQKRA